MALRLAIAFVAAVALAVVVPAQKVELATNELDEVIRRALQEQIVRHDIPGAAMAVVGLRGGVLMTMGVGLADRERQLPVDPNETRFRVASLSKPVAATAIGQLVEQGALTFDQPVDDFLPGLATAGHSHGPILLRHLLTHTAGYDDRNIGRAVRTGSTAPDLATYLIAMQPPRIFATGELCSYSNYGFYVVGHVVEQVSGLPFARYAAQRLFEPLGMAHSSFAIGGGDGPLAVGYRRVGEEIVPVDGGWDVGVAASGLSTTAGDYGRFLLLHLGNGTFAGKQVVASETLATLQQRQFSSHERVGGSCFGWFESYRHGWRRLEHGGHWTGFSAHAAVVPGAGVGVFVAMNAEWAGWSVSAFVNELLDLVLTRREGAVPERAPAPVVQPGHAREVAGTYCTTYRAHNNLEAVVSLLSHVEVKATGPGRLTYAYTDYVETEPYLFVPATMQKYQSYAGPIAFHRAGDGTWRMVSGSFSYERVPWFDAVDFQVAAVITFATTVGLSLLLGLIAFVRRMRGRVVAWEHRLLGVLGVLFVVVMAGLVMAVDYADGSNGGEFAFGVPWWATLLLAVPLGMAALTVVAAGTAIRAWFTRRGGIVFRTWLGFAALSHLGFLAWLWHWNLLGYCV